MATGALVITTNPLKQGLKTYNRFLEIDLHLCHNNESIKTRIETICLCRYVSNNVGHNNESIKTRIETLILIQATGILQRS